MFGYIYTLMSVIVATKFTTQVKNVMSKKYKQYVFNRLHKTNIISFKECIGVSYINPYFDL